jgi:ABC-2 type transport system ATP-binding protein
LAVLEFEGIEKSYGETRAVNGVSFHVNKGEVLGLLGPNGAGKTTLIRILMDIIRADAGTVRLFGEPHRRDQLDRVGYLPEERGLYTKHKVLDVLAYFGMLKGLGRGEARHRATEWLARVELPHVAKWRVERLSKGMSQKVQIAAALLADPELCVLDEPFSGLDPVNVQLVLSLIRARRDAGVTTILSTHQMNMVEELCDRVALIDAGKLMVYGEVAEVRQRYSEREVRVGLADGAHTMPTIPGVVSVTAENGTRFRLLLSPETTPEAVLGELIRQGALVEHYEKVLAPMEQIFISVVRGEHREERA